MKSTSYLMIRTSLAMLLMFSVTTAAQALSIADNAIRSYIAAFLVQQSNGTVAPEAP
jgi:hypothetical protein